MLPASPRGQMSADGSPSPELMQPKVFSPCAIIGSTKRKPMAARLLGWPCRAQASLSGHVATIVVLFCTGTQERELPFCVVSMYFSVTW